MKCERSELQQLLVSSNATLGVGRPNARMAAPATKEGAYQRRFLLQGP